MATPSAPWWQRVDEAAELIASTVNAAAAQARRDGVYVPPDGTPAPRRRRHAASLRHLAEVIRAHRMAPGLAVDKDVVAGVLAGDRRYLSDPVAVVAVARASHHIAGVPFGPDDARRLAVAVGHLGTLIDAAREADRRAPDLLPVPRPSSELVRQETELPRRRRWLPWAVVLAIFAAGVGSGVAGSRLAAGSAEPTPGAAPTPATGWGCLPSGVPRPDGALVMGPPGTPSVPSIRPDWWSNAVNMGLTTRPAGFVAAVPAGSTLPYEQMVIRSGITLIAGHRYRLDFTVTADRSVDVLLRVQDKRPPAFQPALMESLPLSRVPCRHSYTFTAGRTVTDIGEVTFQLGGVGALVVTVDDAVLVDTGV
ncbi:hypothetical protein ACGFJ7_28435 [Actinoplanes sp. NPDC048988]|uniref:hypothetical protein n=1 Tax=Actinoplanes sp. NPDC048988 TaxID=3363901 RepID=UPI003710FCDD